MKIASVSKMGFKDLIVFDLDGTLTPTKSPMDDEMSALMARLLLVKRVAVIGGGKYGLFRRQLLARLDVPKQLLKRLFLFPTTATSFYRYQSGWRKIYANKLSSAQRRRIKSAIREVLEKIKYRPPPKVYGVVIEDRGTQVTFSALGQDVVAVLGKKRGTALKEKWSRENHGTKMRLAKALAKRLPEFEVRAAGFTSVDVTGKGIDKGYGLRQITKYLGVKIKKMLFLGDAIFPGGNDYAVVKTGVDYIPVNGAEETKKIIVGLLDNVGR